MSLPPDSIAIVGMSGRFPGAQDVEAFWQNLIAGRETITRFGEDETEFSLVSPTAKARGAKVVRARGILEEAGMFDADFFGIAPREAEVMDPQHRIFLECAWEAIESAGYDPGQYGGLIGVYAGLSLSSYLLFNLNKASNAAARLAGGYPVGDFSVMLGNERDYLPTRVAYKLNLRGPSIAVQTACSTSLVAICQACTALQTWQCDMALAGGVSVTFPQRREYLYEEDGMISEDGYCRSFDAEAQGTVFSDGAGVVLLKRLADAEADGDTVLAVIRGSALNNDGSEKIGFAAPGLKAQAAVISLAQATAGVEPASISYVEAHGTATPLGDPIEVAALTKAFRDGGAKASEFCALGSAKTHIGHLDVAAGVAGLIKTVLQLQHEHIPALLHYQTPNPRIDFANSPFFPAAQDRPWPRGGSPRRAGISSFGVGGTNAHVVVEESPVAEGVPSSRKSQLLLLSARSAVALRKMEERLADYFEKHPDLDLADVSYTLAVGRRTFGFRRSVVARTAMEAASLLRDSVVGFAALPSDPRRAAADAIAALAASPEPASLQALLGDLWVAGVAPDWDAYFAMETRRRVPLPTYPFERKKYWIEAPKGEAEAEEEILNPPLTAGPNRRANLVQTLRQMVEELSGRKLEDSGAAFSEMGFDSLALTQVSQAVFTRFGVKVTFRQLLGDAATLDALAALVDTELPEDAPAPLLAPANKTAGSRLPVVRWPGGGGPILVASTRFGPYKPVQRESVALSDRQKRALDDLISRYLRRTGKSKVYTAEHRAHFADPRAVAGFNPFWKEMVYPIVSSRSKGSTIWDIDGNAYVDLTMGFGTYFFGHSPDWLVNAVQDQLHQGIEIGPQSASAGAIARDVCEFTGMERVTFCNTGSEAVMAALRLARMVTGRTRVACFTGDYHGMFDEVLVRGSWVNGEYRAQPIAPGIPASLVENMLVLDYGSPETLEILRRHANELAAILVEPVQSRRPDLQPRAFMQEVRTISERAGAALIFDEVVTGFRCHPGGAQAMFGVQADLATYGKVLGGGIPIGVLAGKRRFMDGLDGGDWKYGDDSHPEAGMTFFAGTFVRHPLAMAAARSVIAHLREEGPGLQLRMTERTAILARTLNTNFDAAGVPFHVPHFSAVAGLEHAPDLPHASLLWFYLREKGIHIWEGRPIYLTSAHTDEDFDKVVTAFRDSVEEMQEAGFLPPRPADKSLGLVGEFPRIDRAPTTEAQREIWTSAALGADANRAYNEASTVEFEGRLDLPAFEKSVLHVVQRHHALRSTFSSDGTEQLFFPAPSRVELTFTDLTALPEERRADQLEEEKKRCSAHVFDLVNGPVALWHLVQLGERRHVLLFTAHHLVCDGWSLGMIVEELSLSYNAFLAGRLPMLPPPLPFGDHARALQNLQAADATDRDYWVSLFEKRPPALELPLDRPRPAFKSFPGAMETLVVDGKRFARLKKAAPALGGTVFTTLLAVFATLLHRLSGQDDIVIGVPSAGQTLAGCNELVGHCLNFLPLRLNCDGSQSFQAFANAASQTVIEAYEHQNYTFGSLVRELRLPRDASRLPLVSVMFNIDKSGFDHLKFDGLRFRVGTNAKQFVNFDLFFNLAQSEERLEIECEYNTDLFNAATVRSWMAAFERLIESVLEDGSRSLDVLPILGEDEERKVAHAWNSTSSSFSGSQSVQQLVSAVAASRSGKAAVVCGARTLSYGELDEKSNRLAARLQALGVNHGDLVGLCIERSPEMVVGLLGILKSGAAYVPMDPSFPAQRLAYMVEDARMPVLVTQRDLTDGLPEHNAKTVLLDEPLPEVSDSFVPANGGGEAPAYVIFTSGSTGRPKGVRIPHRALINFLTSMRREPGLSSDDILLSVTTLSFDIAGLEIFLPLTTGATVAIASRETAVDGNLLKAEIERTGATVMQATPATWRLLLEAGWKGSPRMKILVGGEAVPRELVNLLLPRCDSLWNLYGPTETTIWSTVARVEGGDGPVLIGRPIDNTQVYIVNSALELQPVGVPGELLIGGDGLALDYLNSPELTAERFIPNPVPGSPSAKVYRTGDLARWRDNGQIECLGRLDFQIKLRGFRIEPGEIESILERCPGVAQAVVDVRDERLISWLRLHESARALEGGTLWQDKWESIFQTAIDQSASSDLDHLDAIINSWTGVENAGEQVAEWIDVTVSRIREFQPRRILEIGCGTGQLLAKLAPDAESYWAADISRHAIEALQRTISLPQVRLFQRPADDFSGIPAGEFDTVVINSVAQYFPDGDYLRRVLAGALGVVKKGGRVFLGDIQSHALLPVHHAEALCTREKSVMTCGQLRAKLEHRVAREKELCLDPAWFELLDLPGLAHCDTRLRRGKLRNETTDYHYDVVLFAGEAPALLPLPDWNEWTGGDALRVALAAKPDSFAVRGIPDARLVPQIGFLQAVREAPAESPLPELAKVPADAASAEDLDEIAREAGYRAFVRWQGDGTSGRLECVFLAGEGSPKWPAIAVTASQQSMVSVPWREEAGRGHRELSERLRRDLRDKLPDYMVPSCFLVVDAMPLTPNGKIDRRALPSPDRSRVTGDTGVPVTEREKELAELWGELLNIDGISRDDDFFELGGHSLFAFRLFAEIQKRHGVFLPLASLFRAPTLRALAELLDRELSGEASVSRELESVIAPIQEAGNKPPFFCIHGGDGGVIFYRDLAKHLPDDRPLLAIESPALSGDGEIKFEPVEEMAARYLELLRRCQAKGPYFLGGYSFGGLVAYEMACLLREQGERVDFLALFDTISPTSPRRMYTLPERIYRNWNAETELPKRLARILRRAKQKIAPVPAPEEPQVPEDGNGRAWELGKAHEASFEAYKPRPYQGKVTLFKALADDEIYKFPEDYGWAALATEIEIVNIPGRHLTVFDAEHLPIFGSHLRQRILALEKD